MRIDCSERVPGLTEPHSGLLESSQPVILAGPQTAARVGNRAEVKLVPEDRGTGAQVRSEVVSIARQGRLPIRGGVSRDDSIAALPLRRSSHSLMTSRSRREER